MSRYSLIPVIVLLFLIGCSANFIFVRNSEQVEIKASADNDIDSVKLIQGHSLEVKTDSLK